MNAFLNSPRFLKGSIILLDPRITAVQRIVSLRCNPDSLTPSLQTQPANIDNGGDRFAILRFEGPTIELIKLDAAIAATIHQGGAP